MTFGNETTLTVTRNGDLMSKCYLKVIVSGYDTGDATKQWSWVNKLGLAIIKEVKVEIGGTQIDKQTGEWMNLWNELSRNFALDKGFDIMIGNVPSMVKLAQSHPEYTLFVPLRFFFNRHVANSLPLIALQYHEVRFYVTLNSVDKLVTRTANLELTTLATNLSLKNSSLLVEYHFLDVPEREAFAIHTHEYLIEQVQLPATDQVNSSTINTKLNFNHPTKEIVWNTKLNKYLNTNNKTFFAYSSTSTDELLINATRRFVLRTCLYVLSAGTLSLGHIQTDIRLVPGLGVTSDVFRIFKELDPRYAVLTDFSESNVNIFGRYLTLEEASRYTDDLLGGALFNGTLANPPLSTTALLVYTGTHPANNDAIYGGVNLAAGGDVAVDVNYVGAALAPQYQALLNASVGRSSFDIVLKQFDNYGTYIDKSMNTTGTATLVFNGQERFNAREGNYFNYVQPWQCHSNTPQDGVNVYSFALQPENHAPSGTVNFSRIDSTQLKIEYVNSVNSVNNGILTVYAFNYNVLRITSGMGGLAYAS